MLLLTGATGLVGSALLERLLREQRPVRCLVREPRRLGPHRVRVQIALGDLAHPGSLRNALRGVDTIVHLAAPTRDQPQGTIEELVALATWRMVQAAQRAGVQRFVFFSALGASAHSRTRLFRAKAVAERIVRESSLHSLVLAPSMVYDVHDPWLRRIERLGVLPVVPVPAQAARCQPIWARDVADCTMAALDDGVGDADVRYELAGPQTLSYEQTIRLVQRAAGRSRPLVRVPAGLARRGVGLIERLSGEQAPFAWDEVQLLLDDATSTRGDADARALGVQPRAMRDVLGG